MPTLGGYKFFDKLPMLGVAASCFFASHRCINELLPNGGWRRGKMAMDLINRESAGGYMVS